MTFYLQLTIQIIKVNSEITYAYINYTNLIQALIKHTENYTF